MLNHTLIGTCALGTVYSYDWDWRIVIVTADGEKLGADEQPGESRFFHPADDFDTIIDGNTGNMYEVN